MQPKPLAVMGEVPEFQLTAQTGEPFDSQSLDGHIWVADFIYTTCDGPCPMMTAQMHRVQISTAETPGRQAGLLHRRSCARYAPVLAEYAKHFKADFDRWYFLTGEQSRLNDIALSGFKLNGVDGSMTHSTRFVLVDRSRRIRGYYISSEDAFMPQLIHDIRQLEREKS